VKISYYENIIPAPFFTSISR